MAASEPALIALDWGTTSLRAYLLDGQGAVLDRRAAQHGVMQVAREALPAAFTDLTRAWRASHPSLPAIASGMVGSTVGWVEAPYAPCPAEDTTLAAALCPVPGHGLHIVPGIAQRGVCPNVMRGEETQVFGALHLHPSLRGRCRLVLPGTHSKWVAMAAGRVEAFDTWMTGELFAVLRAHSILGRPAEGLPAPAGPEAEAAFDRGVSAVREHGGAARLLFTARSLVLTGGLPPAEVPDYLSGLLIGGEIVEAAPAPGETLALIGDPALCARYRRALAAFGIAEVPILDAAEATTAGLWRLAGLAGLRGGEG